MSEDMRDSPRASLGSAANMVWSFDIKGQNGDVLFGQEPHPWVRTPQRAPPLFLGIASRQRGGHAVTTYKWYAFCGYVWKEDAPNPVVHHDCSSSTCASVLKRFFAARGVPTLSISDKDSQFIYNETHSFVNSRGTKWQFNLPSVPWWVTCLNGWYDAWKGVWKSYYDGLD